MITSFVVVGLGGSMWPRFRSNVDIRDQSLESFLLLKTRTKQGWMNTSSDMRSGVTSVIACAWKAAVAVNFHQLYLQNHPQLPKQMVLSYVSQVGCIFLFLVFE